MQNPAQSSAASFSRAQSLLNACFAVDLNCRILISLRASNVRGAMMMNVENFQ
jgi:hypothetical protein